MTPTMNLPVPPPLQPMLAKLSDEMPAGDGWLFEPKWDGFRALVFRDGSDLFLQSRDRKPLDRYFPELVAPLLKALPERAVIDGEIIALGPTGLEFGLLQLRLHPAESRVKKLAAESPAQFVAFDLVALADEDLRGRPFAERRELLVASLADTAPPIYVTPITADRAVARRWFESLEGVGVEGLIAKPSNLCYLPNKRVMVKVKHVRTADCVVAGFRWHKKDPGKLVGSLLLGLYDDDGRLHHAGITSSFNMTRRRELARELEPLRRGAAEDHPWCGGSEDQAQQASTRQPGGHSRWSRGKDLSWLPLRLERVVEVKYDYLQHGRFRHATTFLRWRPDRSPEDCRYSQLEGPAESALDLATLLASAE